MSLRPEALPSSLPLGAKWVACAAIVSLLTLASPVLADGGVLAKRFKTQADRAWSARDFATALPYPLPRVDRRLPQPGEMSSPRAAIAPEDRLDHEGIDDGDVARPPSLSRRQRRQFRRVLFDRRLLEAERIESGPGIGDRTPSTDAPDVAEPQAYGTGGLDFTSSRLIPTSAAEEYPYSTVGKLFFFDGLDAFVCSASVIARRLVLTAAHCVYDQEVGFYQNFSFAPAYRYGEAPYGLWTVAVAFVTTSWAANSEVPSDQDFAILEMEDQDERTIQDVTGSLSVDPFQAADNHIHMLGYPTNLDDGQEMHQVTSGDFFAFSDGTVVYGSDMTGGSSGSPWIVNFSRLADGQNVKLYRSITQLGVVGVVSYGFTNPYILAQGAADLQEDFVRLRKEACTNRVGNCHGLRPVSPRHAP